jgi:hypothetical protein
MKALLPVQLSILALVSTIAAAPSAYGEPAIGSMRIAIPWCGRAVRHEIVSHAPKFDDRVVLTGSRERVRTVKLTGTMWDDGVKIPFEARCERNATGRVVAYLGNPSKPAVAAVTKE